MAILKDHEQDCINALGQPFTEVHQWLDAFFLNVDFARGIFKELPVQYLADPTRHRCLRHTVKGLRELKRVYGDLAYEAGVIHVRRDLADEKYYGPIPLDEKAYLDLGLW